MATGDVMWQCPFCLKTHYHSGGCDCKGWNECKHRSEEWKRLFDTPSFSIPTSPIPGCPDIVMIDENDRVPPVIKNNTVMETGNSCPVCGSPMVSIRGKYPNSPRRIVCPTCMADKLDAIRNLIDPNDGYGKQEKK